MSRNVGLHFRLNETIFDCAQQAVQLKIPHFQCFFIHQHTGKHINLDAKESKRVFDFKRDNFDRLFAHAAYWINLACGNTRGAQHVLKRELGLAKAFGFDYLVLHPGSANGHTDNQKGVEAIARRLNRLLKHEEDVTVLLENTAHAKRSIGGNIKELAAIRQLLDQPEKVQFCIDTAHAHSYGYDLVTQNGCDEFLGLVDNLLGFDSVALIHLNDSHEKRGSNRDRHAIVGEGLLAQSLPYLMKDSRVSGIPSIMELPPLADEQQVDIIQKVCGW